MAVTKRLCPFFLTRNTAIAGYKVYTKITGLSTLKTSYKDAEAAASHANPITLDASGMPTTGAIWLDTDIAYRIELKDSTGATTYFTQDNVVGIMDPTAFAYTSENIKFADGEGIADANGNEILTATKATSAVNQFNMQNSATGDEVLLESAGSDSNIDIHIKAKGTTGDIKFTARGNAISLPTAAPTTGQLVYASSATQWAYHNGTGYFAGQKNGLTLENAADADHDITVAVGSARDSSDAVTIVLGSAMTKRIDAGWTAGTGNGGLASGVALAADTWYHVHLIQESDGTVDVGFDTSLTAVALLADSTYPYYKYLGSVLTDASANILGFTQAKDIFIWDAPTLSINTTTLTTSSAASAIAVPLGVMCEALMNCTMTNAGAASVYFRDVNGTDSAPSTSAAPLADLYCGAGLTVQQHCSVITNTSSQIYARSSAASTTLKAAVKHYRNFAL